VVPGKILQDVVSEISWRSCIATNDVGEYL
jgi:hypothetical protein